MTVPYWVPDAIFYQIFPDRFANGEPQNDPPNVQPWGSPPSRWGFQGGDLRGIIQHFDYLLDLGINAIYLNPIFSSPSTHRYNITDYYKIDPRLGEMRDFHALIDLAHQNEVRIILDGVFNHCSRGFFAFIDILENQENSPYCDWFHLRKFPVDAYSPGNAESYLAWWGFKSLPKFNTDTPAVRKYLFDVARYWIQQGADGWRLDVPNEIDDDSFWSEFRRLVKSENPDAYLLGEIWQADPHWVGKNKFDGLMNYPLRDAILDFLMKSSSGKDGTTARFMSQLENLHTMYPRENVFAMFSNLGTHDTERIYTMLQGNLDKVMLAFTITFSLAGAPVIYYGDEIGLQGGKDPECRGAFPWSPDAWRIEVRKKIQKLIAVRKRLPAMRRGAFQRLFVEDKRHCLAFMRVLGDQSVLVALNASPSQHSLRIKISNTQWGDGQILHNALGKEEFIVSGEEVVITLPAWESVWLC